MDSLVRTSASAFAGLSILCFGCAQPTDAEAENTARPYTARIEAVEELERGVREVSQRAAELDQMFASAREQFEKARLKHEESQRVSANSVAASQAAIEEFAKAEQRWRYFQTLVEVAAAVDAANLEKFRAATKTKGVTSLHCEDGMSTAAFRHQLTALGKNIQGHDVDHIVPRSLGGADHPANYQLLPSSVNRSIGNQWDSEKCLAAGAKCAGAVAISRKCGTYSGSGI